MLTIDITQTIKMRSIINCDCWFQDEGDLELQNKNGNHSYLLKEFVTSNPAISVLPPMGEVPHRKISLRRKMHSMKATLNEIDDRIITSAPAQQPPKKQIQVTQQIHCQVPQIYQKTPIALQFKHEIPRMPVRFAEQIKIPHPIILLDHEKNHYIKKPQIKISFQQPAMYTERKILPYQTVHLQVKHQSINFDPVPRKVNFGSMAESTHIDSGQNKQKIGVTCNRQMIQKSSIEFQSQKSSFVNEFKGKLSIDVPKINWIQPNPNHYHSANQIEQVQQINKIVCKKAESIRGENDNSDSMDRISQVVRDDNMGEPGGLVRLMTSSLTAFEKSQPKNRDKNKSKFGDNLYPESLSEF